jgi:pyrroloquinoline quinone (PQQ) biosynthesis protein C
LRFKRFEIQDNESIIWSLRRFAAIECVLPGVFTKYIEGIHKIFPGIDDHTLEYFPIEAVVDRALIAHREAASALVEERDAQSHQFE